MPTLHRRSNNIFYMITCTNGKRKWLSLHTRDEYKARTAMVEYSCEQRKRGILRISAFANNFVNHAHLSVSKSTVGIYRSAFSNFVRLCGNKAIKAVTPLDVERYKVLRSKEVSPITVNIDLRTLRAGFNQARRLRFIDECPFERLKLTRVERYEAVFLTEKNVHELLGKIDDVVFRNLVLFTILTIMRLGEVVHLEWSDIDLIRREIRIRNKKGFQVKGGKPRTIPMNGWVYDFLSSEKGSVGFVFKNQKGRPLIGGSVSHKFKRYVRKAKLNDAIHFHSLRHTGISLLVNNGVPQPVVQRIAGLSCLQMTDLYTHIEDKNLFWAVNNFPRFG